MGVRRDHPRHSKRVTSTRRWQVLRMAVLERDRFRCRSCGARGRLEIDHIKPVRAAPELAFDPTNCQALCPACHTRKTRIECGHPASTRSPERDAWAQAVAELAPRGTHHSINTE